MRSVSCGAPSRSAVSAEWVGSGGRSARITAPASPIPSATRASTQSTSASSGVRRASPAPRQLCVPRRAFRWRTSLPHRSVPAPAAVMQPEHPLRLRHRPPEMRLHTPLDTRNQWHGTCLRPDWYSESVYIASSAACTPEDRWFLATSGGRRSPPFRIGGSSRGATPDRVTVTGHRKCASAPQSRASPSRASSSTCRRFPWTTPVRRELPDDWTERYNTTPVLIETFDETPRLAGALYKASGWTPVGTTRGRGRYNRHTRRSQPKKDIRLRSLRIGLRNCHRWGGRFGARQRGRRLRRHRGRGRGGVNQVFAAEERSADGQDCAASR